MKISRFLRQTTNPATFALVTLAVLAALILLIFGLVGQVSGTALASTLLPDSILARETAPADIYRAEYRQAMTQGDWAAAVIIAEKLYELEPATVETDQRLAEAQTRLGLSLRGRGYVDEALAHFERAVAIAPRDARAVEELRLAKYYLSGIEHYQQGNWPVAIDALEKVWQANPNYPNVRDVLYSAYYNHALALQAADRLLLAKRALRKATVLRPDQSAPRLLLAQLEFARAEATPLEVPLGSPLIKDRLIIVGLAEQRMWVFEKDRLVFDFVVSTGEPGRETAVGEFEILNKIDVADGATWNLDMPYWMGIYWAGPLQNGIHALPIERHTGNKLWDGFLGQRVSYGCVILGDEDAATLYQWAAVGTKMKIVPSLTDWANSEGY
ncbi:MAG TPA: L,D-transpeptidase family protein [Anaerolineae bacterium]|nr:L,D-transpeptidase family protein [Anaerolineae bacterium]HMR67230.1 L,D-transpeptidase family protein [Anaerolineae bacterium]